MNVSRNLRPSGRYFLPPRRKAKSRTKTRPGFFKKCQLLPRLIEKQIYLNTQSKNPHSSSLLHSIKSNVAIELPASTFCLYRVSQNSRVSNSERGREGPILSVPALKLQNRQHNLLFGECCLKKSF
jgi:hypothetical protein